MNKKLLDEFNITEGQIAAERASSTNCKRPARRRYSRPFYTVDEAWFDAAERVVGSPEQLGIAVRIFQRWRRRKLDHDAVRISNVAVAGNGRHHRRMKAAAVEALEAAGLLEVVDRGRGRSPSVKLVMPQLGPAPYPN
jgi:hypothetical protein